jgi:hypothetical protein
MSNTPEGKVKQKIQGWLNVHMPDHWRVMPRGGPFGKIGCPDILICWKGVFIAIEVKSIDGVVSALQMVQLRLIQKAGGVAAVVRGFDVQRLNLIKEEALKHVHD